MDNPDKFYQKIGACHSGVKDYLQFNPKSKNEFFLYIRKDLLVYSLDDLKRWLRFMNYCGFKFHFLKEEKISLGKEPGNPYSYSFSGDVYTLKLKCVEYINNMHIFAALTAMRYIYYNFGFGYIKIPEAVFTLKKEFKGKIDGIQALLLAYHCIGVDDTGHSFSGLEPNHRDKGITISKKSFYKGIKAVVKEKVTTLNSLLYEPSTKSSRKIRSLYEEGNFKALGEYIFNKKEKKNII